MSPQDNKTTPSDDVLELYQETIIEHSRNPRNFKVMDQASSVIEGYNPLCGDSVTIFLKIENGVVKDASFQAKGCAISRAAASLLTEAVKDKPVELVQTIISKLRGELLGNDEPSPSELGELSLLRNVKRFPVRVKCALLAGNTVLKALKK